MTNKAKFLFSALITLSVLYLLESPKNTKTLSKPAPLETRDGLEEWYQMRLADPITGEIPEGIQILERRFLQATLSHEAVSTSNGSNAVDTEPSITFRGPNNLGGRTRALAIDKTNEATLLAGGVSGGLWKSEDAGLSWRRVSKVNVSPSVSAIAQDTRQGRESTWYYGTGEFSGSSSFRSPGDGVFKSTDGGNNWSLIESTSTGNFNAVAFEDFSYVNNIAIDNSNPDEDEVYAAVASKIIRSTDAFQTYETVLGDEDSGTNWSDVAVLPNGRVIATIAGNGQGARGVEGVFISSNGTDWTDISPSGLRSSTIRMKIRINPSNNDEVYIMGLVSLHKYTISTGEWSNFSQNLPDNHGTQGGYDMAIGVHPDNENVVYLGGVSLYRSTNGFNAKDAERINGSTPVQSERLHLDVHRLLFHESDGSKMLAGSDGGVAITTDNLSASIIWQDLNAGYNTSQFYTVALNNTDAGSGQILGGTQDNGTHYIDESGEALDAIKLFGGDGAACLINYNSLIVSAQGGNLVRLKITENGLELEGEIVPSNDGNRFLFINPFVADRVNSDRMAIATRGGVYMVNNTRQVLDESTWRLITLEELEDRNVSALDFSIQPEGTLIVGTTTGKLAKITNITSSNPITQEISIDGLTYVSSISIDPRTDQNLLVCTSNYQIQSIFYSENGGEDWLAVGGNLEENSDGSGNGPSIRWVEIIPNGDNQSIYLAGTSSGLYTTDQLDGVNTTWENLGNEVIGNTSVDMMDVRLVDGTLAIGTHGNGLFEAKFDTPLFATINYSLPEDPADQIVLRGNKSYTDDYVFEYQWLKDDQEISGATEPEHLVNQAGTYRLRLTNTVNNETALSNPILMTPAIITATEGPISEVHPITVLTNPSTGLFEMVLDQNYASGFEYTVIDISGNQVLQSKEQHSLDENFILDLREQPNGIYLVSFVTSHTRQTLKLLKQSR